MYIKTTFQLVYCALLNRHCIIALIIITEDKKRKEKKNPEKYMRKQKQDKQATLKRQERQSIREVKTETEKG